MRLGLVTAGLVLAACRSASDDPRLEIASLEEHRVTRPDAWERLLSRGDDEVRASAALAVGRIRDPALAPALLRALDVESVPHSASMRESPVKVEQLFALGQIGDGEALGVLLAQLGSDEIDLRAAAAEAIGKLAVPSAAPNLVAHLVDPAPSVRGAALLALARLVGRRSAAATRTGDAAAATLDADSRTVFLQVVPTLIADPDAAVRWKTAYALAEIEIDGRAELLAKAAQSNEATVRFFAISGLARLRAPEALRGNTLLAALGDDDPRVAAAAAAGLGRAHAAGAFDLLAATSLRSGHPADFHVRRAALGALADVATAEQSALVLKLATAARGDPSLSVRGEAMGVQVRFGGADAVAAIAQVAGSTAGIHERVAAVRALARGEAGAAGPPLCALAGNSYAYVASEALSALAALAPASEPVRGAALAAARRGAASSDLAVAGSALELLKVVGSKDDLPLVTAAFARLAGFDDAEARTTAVHVAVALAGKDAVELLRRARDDPSPAVVAAAKEEWRKLGLADDPPHSRPREGRPGADVDEGGPPSSVELVPGVDFLSSAPNPRVVLRFARGDVVIELLREQAPHHVKMMMSRVREGRCDGLPIHRVVSGFVVQGLDPRGDGWGSGGLFLRDEINRIPFERGAVGMPNAGPDSGGCQAFVTVVPTPHLDGRYTVFGRVVSGMEVVDALDVGDVCRKAEVIR